MRVGDTRRSEQVRVSIEYELSEDISPTPGKAEPVAGPAEYAKVRKWRINKVFYFLAFSSAGCLAAVAVVPNPVVQGTALGVWAGSVALAKHLLKSAYH